MEIKVVKDILGANDQIAQKNRQLFDKNKVFVVNVMAYEQAVEVLFCGRCSGRNVDKFATANLTPVPAQEVNVPAIAEALAHVECEMEAKHPAGDRRSCPCLVSLLRCFELCC